MQHGHASALLAPLLPQEHAFPPDSAAGSDGAGAYGSSRQGAEEAAGGQASGQGGSSADGGGAERRGGVQGGQAGSRSSGDQQGQQGQVGGHSGGGTIALVCGPPPMVRGSGNGLIFGAQLAKGRRSAARSIRLA